MSTKYNMEVSLETGKQYVSILSISHVGYKYLPIYGHHSPYHTLYGNKKIIIGIIRFGIFVDREKRSILLQAFTRGRYYMYNHHVYEYNNYTDFYSGGTLFE